MEYEDLSKLCSLFARPLSRDLLRLLVLYESISASEAASRLNLHIKTAQDFLEGLTIYGIVRREEVFERKRPYFRYTLITKKIQMDFDLKQLADNGSDGISLDNVKIRETKNANCTFKTSPESNAFSSITIFTGEGRDREERRISLTTQQGKFLFHLPFPTEEPRTVHAILKKSGVKESYLNEILDIIQFMHEKEIIEFKS